MKDGAVCENCGGLYPVPDTVRIDVVARRNPDERRTLILCRGCEKAAEQTWRLRWTVER